MRSRSPKRVRQISQALVGTRAKAIMVASESWLTSPRASPVKSETKNQFLSVNQPRMSGVVQPKRSPPARNGKVNRPTLGVRGDWVIEPPS